MTKPRKFIADADTLETAIAHARDGHPGPLLLRVRDAMGEDVFRVLSDLIRHPETVQRTDPRRALLPHEVDVVRALYDARVRNAKPSERAGQRQRLARSIGIEAETLRDIVSGKKTYAEKVGEKRAKRSPQKKRQT